MKKGQKHLFVIKPRRGGIILAFAICLQSFLVVGQNTVYDTIRYAREYYQQRVSLFKSESTREGSVVFLGNSITEFGDWRRLLNDSTVVNRGVAADNTFGVLDRLEEVIDRKPRKLFIEIGINDISQNIPESIIVRNIHAIVTRVRSTLPETKIYVTSILPTNDNVKNEYPDAYNKNPVAASVNRQLEQKATTFKYVYIDVSRKLSDNNGKLDLKYADPDGLHLNDAGYLLWIRILKEGKYL